MTDLIGISIGNMVWKLGQHGQNCFYDDTGCVIDKSAGRHISTNFLDSMPPPLKGELARCLSGVSPLFTFFPPLLVRRSWWGGLVGVQLSRSNCSSKWFVSLSCGVENVHYVRTQGEEVFKRCLHSAANIYRSSNMDMIYVPGDWKKAFRSPGPQYRYLHIHTLYVTKEAGKVGKPAPGYTTSDSETEWLLRALSSVQQQRWTSTNPPQE